MKKLSFLFFLFVSAQLFAQTKGITYQAIIYNPSGEAIPGVNNTTAPMASKNICLQFSIIDVTSQLEYQETFTTTTDEFGMVNLVIGNGVQVGGTAANFDAITWSADQKSLKVALDVTGQCASFVAVSSQKLEYVPYAFLANSAENVSGIIPIENGGTNASTVLGAKTNLGLENVDNTSDLNKPISIATQAGLDLKENVANKSTITTLGTSDVLYPSQNAVKTYVDASATTLTTAINNEATIRAAADATLTTNLANEVTNRINADATLTTNLATEVTNRTNADAVLTANLATEVTNRTNADATLTTNLATEVTDRTNADLLKENTANKSTATTLGTSNVLFPTQNAVKTYVDGSIASVNTANTALQTTVTALQNTVTTNATNTTASLVLKENTANKSTTTTLGTSDVLFPTQNAVKTYVDGNIATVNAANTATQGTVTTLQNTVTTNAAITTTSLALKENTANKSTTTTLGTSDVLFPTQNAVKTYVDGSITSANTANTSAIAAVQADVDANETAATTAISTLQNTVTTNATNTTASLALKENTANKSTTTTLGTSDVLFPTQNAVKTYVDGSITSANTVNTAAIAAVQADVDANETASNAADVVLQNNITTLGNTVTTNETNTTASLALKENTANKSTTTTLGTSDVLFPTQNAVKTYVDGSITSANTASTSAIAAVQADVDANETASNAADVVLQNNITTLGNTVTTNATNTTTSLALKENTANKSTITTLGASDVLFPTQNAVKTYVDGSITSANTLNTAAIAAVQADVDANETTSNAADVVLQNNITTLGNTVTTNATNTTASLALKENTANKSTTTTLGTSDVLFPTQNAVKTYVDNQVANVTATNVSGIVAVANGGTGSATQNFVDLTTNQTIGGTKTFSSPITVQSNTLKGNGSGSFRNVGLGLSVFNASLTGTWNTAMGAYSMERLTSGSNNTGIGNETMSFITTTSNNTGIGNRSLMNTTGSNNTSLGSNAAVQLTTGDNNLFLGNSSGTQIANNSNLTSLSNSVLIGAGARTAANTETNEIVIGYNAVGNGSNTIQLGNASVTNVNTKGSITANAEISSEITANITINNANSEQYKAKVLICNPTNQITITFSNDLPVGFNCMILQKSADANKIVLAGGTGVTLKNRNNYTATAGNYAIATIVNIGGGIIVTAGDMQ